MKYRITKQRGSINSLPNSVYRDAEVAGVGACRAETTKQIYIRNHNKLAQHYSMQTLTWLTWIHYNGLLYYKNSRYICT